VVIHPLALVDRAEEEEGDEVGEVEEVVAAVVAAVGVMREVVAKEEVGEEVEEEGEGEVGIKVLEDILMPRGRGDMIRRCREWAQSRLRMLGVHTIISSSTCTLPIAH